MLDDLRNSSAFLEEEPETQEEKPVERQFSPQRRNAQQFLGLSPQQRFILSLVLFFMVLILGIFALYISGSIVF